MQAISCRGNQRILVTADGELHAHLQTTDLPRGQHWSGPWPGEPLRRLTPAEHAALARTIEKSGFLTLPEALVTPGRDGFVDEIEIVHGEHGHAVRVERTPAPPAFAAVRRALLALAGPPFAA